MSTKAAREEWRPLPAYPGYEISNHGRLWSSWQRGKRWPPGLRQGRVMKIGYRRYVLQGSEGERCERTAHTLVAETFIGPRPEGLYVLHGDGDKLNNHVDNLRYGTPSENLLDAVDHGTLQVGEDHADALLTEDQVHEIRRLLSTTDLGYAEIGERFDVKFGAVRSIHRGWTWKQLETPGWAPSDQPKRNPRYLPPEIAQEVDRRLLQGEPPARIARAMGLGRSTVSYRKRRAELHEQHREEAA